MRNPIRVLRQNPKLILNAIYSIFINLFISIRFLLKFKIIADFGSYISKARRSKLIVDNRLYLGGKYIGDMAAAKASVKMYEGSTLHIAGRVKVGPGVGIVTGPGAKLTIGDNTYFTASSVIYCTTEMHIGRDCAIAWNTTIIDSDFHRVDYPDDEDRDNSINKPVYIGDKVWIGSNTTILKGVTIGDNVVIGANSLVNKDIPPNCLVVGNPAKVIKKNINWTR